MVAKGKRSAIDLTELKMEFYPEKKIYMFLSLTWAIISDVDINSEYLRCMGDSRFTMYGIFRLMNLRNYKAKLSFLGKRITSKLQDALT